MALMVVTASWHGGFPPAANPALLFFSPLPFSLCQRRQLASRPSEIRIFAFYQFVNVSNSDHISKLNYDASFNISFPPCHVYRNFIMLSSKISIDYKFSVSIIIFKICFFAYSYPDFQALQFHTKFSAKCPFRHSASVYKS